MRSSIIVARLLDSEGFTEHTATAIDRFARSQMTQHQQQRFERLKKAMSELCQNLSVGDKLAIGRFITIHKEMAFQTGVRIGLTAMATKESVQKEYAIEPFWPFADDGNEHDFTYSVELQCHDDSHTWWQETGETFEDRGDAKLFARQQAVALKRPTRIRQMGHIVQRYDSHGRKQGGD